MPSFFRVFKKSSSASSRKEGDVNLFQRSFNAQLNTFQPSVQGKKRSVVQTASAGRIEVEANDELKAFQSCVKQIKEISLKIEELTKLFKSGEISENAYNLIMDELGSQLSLSIEDIFRSREALELVRAKAKLEWAKEKIGMKSGVHPYSAPHERKVTEGIYSPLKSEANVEGTSHPSSGSRKWEEIVSKIDSALSSLTVEEEASIIEQYLSLIKEKLSPKVESEEIAGCIAMCQQRLNLISEKWASIRRGKIEQIMNLELKASQIKDQIKEIDVRFAVGELDRNAYEHEMSILQSSLKKNEKEISSIRKYIDDMDMKMFRCSELLRERP